MSADAGLWIPFGIALRLIVGWFCIVIGLLNMLAETDRRGGGSDIPFWVFHCMLVVGGIVLIALDWLAEDPGLVGYVAGGAVATLGLVLSGLPVISSVCCMFAFGVRHGFPFTFLARGQGDAGRWHVDSQHLIADLLFWGYAGLLTLVAVALCRRFTSRHDEPPRAAAVRNPHAEPVALADQAASAQRADQARDDPPLPADGTVGGLP
jgi:hypothetical protein